MMALRMDQVASGLPAPSESPQTDCWQCRSLICFKVGRSSLSASTGETVLSFSSQLVSRQENQERIFSTVERFLKLLFCETIFSLSLLALRPFLPVGFCLCSLLFPLFLFTTNPRVVSRRRFPLPSLRASGVSS